MLDTISSYVSIGFLAFSLITIAIAFLMGFWRGIFKSAVRTVSLVLSAIISYFLTRTVLASALESMTESMIDMIGGGDAVGDLMQSETTMAVLQAIAVAMVAPLAFLILYLVISKVLLIVCWIINLILKPVYAVEKKVPFRRLIGAGISVLGAMVTLAAIAAPVGGYAEVVAHTVEHIEAVEEKEEAEKPAPAAESNSKKDDDGDEEMEALKKFSNSISNNIFIKIPYALGGRLMFENLTAIDIEKNDTIIDKDIHTDLETEIVGVIDLLPRASALSDINFNSIDHMNIEPLKNLIGALDDEKSSDVVRILLADIFSNASNKWLDGEEYLGINLFELLGEETAMFRQPMTIILGDLRNTHVSSVGSDVEHLIDTLESMKNTYICFMDIQNSLNDGGDISPDDVKNLIVNLTPTAVDAMSEAMGDMLVTGAGMSQENANQLSGIVNDAFSGLAQANVDGTMTDEEIEREAEAITHVMGLAMDTESEITPDRADDLVSSVMGSTVISGSINSNLNSEDGENANMDLPEETASTLQSSLDNYEANNELSAEQAETVASLRNLFAHSTPSDPVN